MMLCVTNEKKNNHGMGHGSQENCRTFAVCNEMNQKNWINATDKNVHEFEGW
jgi:hypothetical protein